MHPYQNAPAYRRWRPAVVEAPEVDPVARAKFRIPAGARIVTAGSCFAQHIARRLPMHYVTEPAHPLLDAATAARFDYGIYSARYGNIYSARQLLQLLRRAEGRFTPEDDIWESGGAFHDPFRPAIEPGGFASRAEYQHDRARHFAAVRRAFREMDIFIFTLGLIEVWENASDGAAYPVCPGAIAGVFDPARHQLRVQTVEEVVADLRAFLAEARAHNPAFRTILTVSPVPLAATALDRHVLDATVLAKSVLRVAADVVAGGDPAVMYFPSYEIATGAFARGRYVGADLRSVSEACVDHVMRVFGRHVMEDTVAGPATPAADSFLERQREAVAVVCEEETLG